MNKTKDIKKSLRQYIFLCIGLAILALGVAFSIKAALGTSPISSLPYVASCICALSVGNLTIIMHCVFVLLQIIILRRQYEIFQLLQLPVAVLFGYLTDLALYLVRGINYTSYWQQWLLCIIGIVLVAVGVSFEVMANVVTLAGEGLILAICKVTPIKFGSMKVIFDVALVVIAVIVSLFSFGRVEGVREGTVAAAVLVGLLSKQFNKLLEKLVLG